MTMMPFLMPSSVRKVLPNVQEPKRLLTRSILVRYIKMLAKSTLKSYRYQFLTYFADSIKYQSDPCVTGLLLSTDVLGHQTLRDTHTSGDG